MELCNRCIGRITIGALGEVPQIEAAEGRAASEELPVTVVAPAQCNICEDAFANVEAWVDAACNALADYEFATFQFGTRFAVELESLEKSAKELLAGEFGDSIRTEANRLVGPLVAERLGKTVVNDARPDVAVTLDTRFWTAEVKANSVYIRGRYTKDRRDLPQTHWPCKTCQGNGCFQCEDTGVMYQDSVEDQICGPMREYFGAPESSFHGSGREDIDARMLGTGRPFIAELKFAKRRTADFAKLQEIVNKSAADQGVTINDLQAAVREDVPELKESPHDKSYIAHCKVEGTLSPEEVQAAAAWFTDTVLEQRTPNRVSHRRADLVRKRTIRSVTVVPSDEDCDFALEILAESGAYIKEFVSGDEERTTPSFAGKLGKPCVVSALDVTAILD